MTAKDMVKILKAESLVVAKEKSMEKDYSKAFASDLMSDVLAMVQHEPESTVLITGLCNAQTIRTAEMLDIDLVIFVRGKKPADDSVEIAGDSGLNVFTTEYTMYETCGILFAKGLGGIYGDRFS